jgi:hypothetical protein
MVLSGIELLLVYPYRENRCNYIILYLINQFGLLIPRAFPNLISPYWVTLSGSGVVPITETWDVAK